MQCLNDKPQAIKSFIRVDELTGGEIREYIIYAGTTDLKGVSDPEKK